MVMLKCAAGIFTMAASLAGFAGSWYWWKSSRVKMVPLWAEYGLAEPVSVGQSNSHWITGILTAAKKSADLNRKGAAWTAFAVGFGAIAALLSAWPICS